MTNLTTRILLMAMGFGLAPATAGAQNFSAVGTRAAGMGGAFVGVADDATAIYWNPAGLAAGSYFSLVLDRRAGEAVPEASVAGEKRSSFLIALTTPALGLGYYRVHTRTATAPPVLTPIDGEAPNRNLTATGEVRLGSLVTHHAGINLVQSITANVAVGATLKLVRGIAGAQSVAAATAEQAFDAQEAELLGRASNRFDVDLGIMAAGGPLKIGLALRNATEPGFATGGGEELTLERHARAGISYAVTRSWIAAADVDLTRASDALGDRRDIAVGVEGRVMDRAYVRSGFRFNTLEHGTLERRRAAAYSVGGSFAVRAAVFLDGHFTAGNERGGREWGIAARFVY